MTAVRAFAQSAHREPTCRHAREGGHPGLHRDTALKSPDPRVRADDHWQRRG